MRAEFTCEGLSELSKKLMQLPSKTAYQFVAKATKVGMTPVLEAAKAAAPVRTGAGKAGLHMNTSTAKNVATTIVSNNRDQYYMLMQDQGWIPQPRYKGRHKVQVVDKKGKVKLRTVGGVRVERTAKPIPGKLFMEQAMEPQIPLVIDLMAQSLRAQLEEEWRR